ncbi:MAG TPA: hypothetical protein VJU59_35240 [Paraburkholderia sp.]|uniref:hypothetical protein n=1 Tax=Paraburkholderia sp. TaxID=1926495 RepID=UPI002B462829|nr:hypothetical protein [Paraburkholderia sp.]HKR44868.1 hypothetical protein [Paraburkholderia sp.]
MDGPEADAERTAEVAKIRAEVMRYRGLLPVTEPKLERWLSVVLWSCLIGAGVGLAVICLQVARLLP